MNAVRTYLLRVAACGFLVSLAGALPLSKRIRQAAILCGGCLMVLTAVGPLLRADLRQLPQFLTEYAGENPEALEEAERKNDLLLKELIESQTEDMITQEALALGLSPEITVEARKDPDSGLYLPWSVELRGAAAGEQKARLEAYLNSLDLPPERQSWLP